MKSYKKKVEYNMDIIRQSSMFGMQQSSMFGC